LELTLLPLSADTAALRLAGMDPAHRAALLADARAALAGGSRRLHVDLTGLDRLDSASVSTLISVLRAARQEGADVALGVVSPAILDTLRVTGLDKLFPREPAPGPGPVVDPPAPPKRRRILGRAATALALLVGIALPDSGTASALDQLQPDHVVAQLSAQNPTMKSYEATLHIDVQLRTFPYIAEHLEGTAYYKRPDNYEVVFSKVPSYARGFDKLFADLGDPSNWERRFVVSVDGEKVVDGRRDVALRLVQRVRGMIDHEEVAVDPRTWRIDEMEWHYYNGGVIAMTQDYQTVDGFNLLKAQHATIRIPFVHASAEGRYEGYHTNVAIDDSVFTRSKK
jgi:anti-anti-sigma factor